MVSPSDNNPDYDDDFELEEECDEEEEDTTETADELVFGDNKLHTEPKQFEADKLARMVDKNQLITHPDYQRDFIYNTEKQSRVIESILLELPIPTVYLAQLQNNAVEVIDGQQRIMSIVNFVTNKYPLKGLRVLKELNRKYYRDLPQEYANIMDMFNLNCIILKKESEQYKFDIFARLNQGSIALNSQEIRNCIYRGRFNNLLKELSKEKLVVEMFMQNNKRMKYEELILRYFALKHNTDYRSSIDKASNEFMSANRDVDAKVISKYKSEFKRVLTLVKDVLGVEAFYGFNRDTLEIIEKFSPTVYDSIMLAFSSFDAPLIRSHGDEIRTKIYEIKKENEAYKIACYAATGSRKNVFGRIKIIENAIAEKLANDAPTDRLFEPELKEKLFYKGYKCSYCGSEILDINDADIDHIKPYSIGGKTIPENAQLLHKTCNQSKGNR